MPANRFQGRGLCIACLLIGVVPTSLFGFQAGKRDDTLSQSAVVAEPVRERIAESAYHEIYGRNDLRDQALQSAASLDATHPVVTGMLGRLEWNGQWLNAEEACEISRNDESLVAYRAFRDSQPETIEGHWAIAQYCVAARLPEQRRAHLSQVVFLSPDHQAAREQLGFVRVDNRWVHQDELDRRAIENEIQSRRFNAWETSVTRLAQQLGKVDDIEVARDRIAEFDQPAALVALEQILGNYSEAAALLLVEHMSGMPEIEATDALIRLAVTSPWESVRQRSAEALAPRDPHQYVPTLLAELSSPIISQWQAIPGARGEVLHQQIFVRDTQDERQVLRNDTQINRRRRPGTVGAESLQRAMNLVDEANQNNADLQQDQNRRIQWLNDRIMTTLRISTGAAIVDDAHAWWRWWNDTNGVYVASALPVNEVRNFEEVELVDSNIYDIPSTNTNVNSNVSTQPPANRYECLVAGTPVWTDRGLVAIESVEVGDMVLSKDVAPGRLEFKPVMRTTERPATRVLHLDLESGERITASAGHPFWVSGSGWVLAGDLKPGMCLHGLNGSFCIRNVSQGDAVPLFNLIVADNQDYFVGKSAILSHDNSLRVATDRVIPGVEK